MEVIISILKAILMLIKYILSQPEIIILLILAILIERFYPKFRGIMGEFWVKLELKKLPKKEYIVLNDIMLEDQNGTHQIDHLVISRYGMFVIEMKNYYGLIIGDEYKHTWSQHLGKKKYYFKNPIHQNYGHIKVLEEMLDINSSIFIPIICFSNQAKVKVNSKSIVTQLDYLIKTIKSFYKVQLNEDINKIANEIKKLNITDKDKRKKHIKDIKEKIKENDIKTNNMMCPKCASDLVLRNGKYGTFLGCSNYPKCKYTKETHVNQK